MLVSKQQKADGFRSSPRDLVMRISALLKGTSASNWFRTRVTGLRDHCSTDWAITPPQYLVNALCWGIGSSYSSISSGMGQRSFVRYNMIHSKTCCSNHLYRVPKCDIIQSCQGCRFQTILCLTVVWWSHKRQTLLQPIAWITLWWTSCSGSEVWNQ